MTVVVPREPNNRHWYRTLSARIALTFGLLMACGWLATLYIELYGIPGGLSDGWIKHIRDGEFQRLAAEAEGRRIHLESWVNERRGDLELIADSEPVRTLLARMPRQSKGASQRTAPDPATLRRTADWLAARRSVSGMIDNLMVVTAGTGELITADDIVAASSLTSVQKRIRSMLRESDAAEFLELIIADDSPRAHLLILRKITATDGITALGYVAALIDLEDEIKGNVETRLITFVGATAEINLYDESGHFISKPRFQNAKGEDLRVLVSVDDSRPASLARRGGEGNLLTNDYRQEMVLAAYRYVRITPEIGWGLVIKKDERETLQAIHEHTDTFILLTAMGLIGVLLVSLWVARRVTRPLRIIVDAARALSGGNWQARANVNNQTEIADVAATFNDMAGRLALWHEDLAQQVKIQTEQILAEEGKLASFSRTTVDAMIIIDDTGCITFWNQAAERIFGYTNSEAVGRNVHFLLTPKNLQAEATTAFAKYAMTGTGPLVNTMREVPAVTKDGRQITVELVISSLLQGGRYFAIGTLRDISHRKRTENALRLVAEHLSVKVGDEYFRSLATTLAELLQADYVLVSEIDADRPGTATTVGAYTPQGLIENFNYPLANSPCAEVLSGTSSMYSSDLQACFPKHHSLSAMGVKTYAGVPLTDKDGHAIGLIATFWCSEMSTDSEVQTLLRIFAARASAELERLHAERALAKHLEFLEVRVNERTAELSQANDELAQALQLIKKAQAELLESEKLASLGSLVAGVAHELNTPIGNSVMASTALTEKIQLFRSAVTTGSLKRSTLNSFLDDLDEGGRYIASSLMRGAELIQGFKQVAVDQTSSQRRRFELKRTIEEVGIMLKPTLKKSGHRLSIQVPDGITLDSYPGPFGQVLTNLIQNALTHAFTGKENGSITISAKPTDELVQVIVNDDGCGMSEEVLARVFEPFFTTKLGQGGSGLGMNITYNLVTGVLGGRIALSSAPQEGTTVRIELPLKAPVPEPASENIKG